MSKENSLLEGFDFEEKLKISHQKDFDHPCPNSKSIKKSRKHQINVNNEDNVVNCDSKFEHIPNEVLYKIISYLDIRDNLVCRKVSRRFKEIAENVHESRCKYFRLRSGKVYRRS